MRVVAIEGPSLAGKSTLIRALRQRLPEATPLPCYVDELSPFAVPAVNPGTTAGQIDAFRTFMTVELMRVDAVKDLRSDSLVILDRSIDTLLAHATTLDRIYGYQSAPAITAELFQHPFLRPDLSIYLDTKPAVLTDRLQSRSPSFPSELVDKQFLAYFRAHFASDVKVSRHVVFFESTEAPPESDERLEMLVELVKGDN